MVKIERKRIRYHSKASEKYVDVVFTYDEKTHFHTSIPIEYRRTGTDILDEEIENYLKQVGETVAPESWDQWRADQSKFWDSKPGAEITREFFDILIKNFEWCCVTCTLPKNPNPARRIQDIKECGYTLATHTNRSCENCNKNTTQIAIVPLPRGGITGYETWTPQLRRRIVEVLGSFDAFEAKKTRKEGLLPDHKFPEIRWDADTKRESLEGLSDEDIKRDFQLLSNQRNQQKREVCRRCFQTGCRGQVYGIDFFYRGVGTWDPIYPNRGKEAEAGCVGCGWYDLNAWRAALIDKVKS